MMHTHIMSNTTYNMSAQIDNGGTSVNGVNGSTDEELTSLLIFSIIDCFLMVLIITGNTLTIIAVTVNRRLSHVLSNHFILSLAVSDLLVGLIMPYHMAFYVRPSLAEMFIPCLVRLGLMSLACIASLLNIIVIACDRFIAIVYPLHYTKYITKRSARMMSLFAWLLAIIIATAPFYWNNWENGTEKRCELGFILSPYYVGAVYIPAFITIFIILCFVHYHIVREARKHARRMRESNICKTDSPNCWKSIQVLMLVMGFFTICYTPYLLGIIANTIFHLRKGGAATFYKVANSLAMANSGINPLIYAAKNKEIKEVFYRILRCKSINGVTHEVRSHSSAGDNSDIRSRGVSKCPLRWSLRRSDSESAADGQTAKLEVISTISASDTLAVIPN